MRSHPERDALLAAGKRANCTVGLYAPEWALLDAMQRRGWSNVAVIEKALRLTRYYWVETGDLELPDTPARLDVVGAASA